MKKRNCGLNILALAVVSLQLSTFAASPNNFVQYYDSAQANYAQGQYSSAIIDFRKALNINYLDNSARIGIINSYLARATYYANQERKYDKAANDFRSALFYLKMYPSKEESIQNSSVMIASAHENLNQCLNVIGFDKSAVSRYKKAEELRVMGNFSASAYEFLMSAENKSITHDAYIQIALLMTLLRNEPRSADYYKLALDIQPSDSLTRMKYARTLDKLGRYDDAVVQYNAVLANCKGDMEILYSLENIYHRKLAQTPSDAELNANMGAIKQAQGDLESALGYYSKAEQLNPGNVNTRLNVGTLFQQKKEYAKAIKAYDSVLTLYPDNIQANLYKAQVLSEMGDKKSALTLYKKVLSLDANNEIAKNELTDVLEGTMSAEEYVKYLVQNSSDKNIKNILYDYAVKQHKENKIDNAIMAYKAAIDTNSSNENAYVNLAICYASQNDYKSAINILNTAKIKFPSSNLVVKTLQDVQKDNLSTTLSNAGESYEKKDYKKAIAEYSLINPPTEASLLGIAASYNALEMPDKAIEYYKKAEVISPKNADIPYYIGYLYSEQKKWLEAEGYLRKSLSINQNNDASELLTYVVQNRVNILLDDGIKLYEKKDFANSLVKFNDILKKDSKNAYAYYYRALIFDEQNRTQDAINDYLKVLEYTVEIPITNYMLAIDYDNLGKYKEAYLYYRKFTECYTNADEYLNYTKSRMEELKKYAT